MKPLNKKNVRQYARLIQKTYTEEMLKRDFPELADKIINIYNACDTNETCTCTCTKQVSNLLSGWLSRKEFTASFNRFIDE